jgi:glyoxylate reductase
MSDASRGRVVVSAELPGPALAMLRAAHDVEVGPDPRGLGKARLLPRVAGADALVALLTDRIDEEVLAAAPRLRVVANCAVGVDNVDLEACRQRGVVVTNTPGVLDEATADLTFALILDACRRVSEGDRLVRSRAWRGWAPTELLGVRVTGAALGIVGLGRIGREVARRARGFSMRVGYTQRRRAPEDVERELGATFRELDALLAESDIVCVCTPLTDATRGLVSAARIERMKTGAVLVNTSRGACVDERAVARALRSGKLAAAGLDVYEREPELAEELFGCERAVLLPHIGSADEPTRAAMARICAESVLAVLAGRDPKCRIA